MKRLAVAMLFGLIVIPIVLYLSNRRPKEPTWQVVGCSVLKQYESARLTLSGPTLIEAEDPRGECAVPVGTEFNDLGGGYICETKEVPKHSTSTCFHIVSETKR
jgi:hypothetical protein